MTEPRSFVRFKDGHEEDIIWFDEYGNDGLAFATKSGMYVHKGQTFSLAGIGGLEPTTNFQKLEFTEVVSNRSGLPMIEFCDAPDLMSYTIDKRVPYSYFINDNNGVVITGKVFASPAAGENHIRELIMEDLDVEYKKE